VSFLQRLLGKEDRPNPEVVRQMARTKERNYATLKQAAIEAGDVDLLRFVKQREADLELLKAEADLMSGEGARRETRR